jgi:hypothetical protein
VPAIEESIFAGVPINVTLLFSREQYLAVAEAYLRGIERRLAKGLDPRVESVASIFVSRWDTAVKDKVPSDLQNKLGIAMGRRAYQAYRELLASPRMQKLVAAGAHPQRLLWASTGTKDPAASDTLYVEALAAPDTVDTMPDKTLLAFADHGRVGAPMATDGGDAEAVIAAVAGQGVDVDALATQLQKRRRRGVLEVVGRPHRRPARQDDAVGRSARGMSVRVDERPAWRALAAHHSEIGERHLRALFAEDPARGERLVLDAAGLHLDYSKNRVSDETMRLLVDLGRECGVRERTAAMFRGDVINTTERRAVLHVALRKPASDTLLVGGGVDVVARCTAFWTGWWPSPSRFATATGAATPAPASATFVNIGIGRLRPRAGDGVRGAALLQRSRPHRPLRLQRRRHRPGRGDARPRPGRNALHRLLQDLHDA